MQYNSKRNKWNLVHILCWLFTLSVWKTLQAIQVRLIFIYLCFHIKLLPNSFWLAQKLHYFSEELNFTFFKNGRKPYVCWGWEHWCHLWQQKFRYYTWYHWSHHQGRATMTNISFLILEKVVMYTLSRHVQFYCRITRQLIQIISGNRELTPYFKAGYMVISLRNLLSDRSGRLYGWYLSDFQVNMRNTERPL